MMPSIPITRLVIEDFRMRLKTVFALCLIAPLAACQGVKTEAKYPHNRQPGQNDIQYAGERQSIFGKGGMGLFGSKDKKDGTTGVGITVNAYLWRAALDTISFMPIANADPFGGTIITDWYEDPAVKGERVKANILILSRVLRTDALKVSLFRQVQAGGAWKDAPVDPKTVTALEDTILTRARQLKVAAAAQ
jgi:hypothetical protein